MNEAWEETTEATGDVTIEEMQEAVSQLRQAKDSYADKKAISEEAYSHVKEYEGKLIEMLEKTGQRTFEVTGIGKATVSTELSVKTPKTNEEKVAFFSWVKANMGQDAHDAYMTVNSRSLNTLYKQASEEAAARGEVLDIDGLEQPSSRSKLSFKKA